MKKDTRLESLLSETGEILEMGKEEIKNVVKSKRNVIVAGVMTVLALIIVDNVASLGTRYAGASMHDFVQMGKFL